jgi:predicted Fe-Mo cluster-binding NifX family protein
MLVAIPNFQGRVSPVFDVAARLTVVRVKGGMEQERRDVRLWETRPEGIVRCLAGLGVNLLICGAVSQMLELLLHRAGVRVVAQVCGEVDAVIQAFLSRTLDTPEFCLPGCYANRQTRHGSPGRVQTIAPHPCRRPPRGRRNLKPQLNLK